jgi:hypothetical protein
VCLLFVKVIGKFPVALMGPHVNKLNNVAGRPNHIYFMSLIIWANSAYQIIYSYVIMNIDTDYLKEIAVEISASSIEDEYGKIANHHLKNEVKHLEKAIVQNLQQIDNGTQRDAFHFNVISKLVNICDILYCGSASIDANVQIILDLLTTIKAISPSEIYLNVELPKAFILIHERKFRNEWANNKNEMHRHQISGELIEIAGIPFEQFKLEKQSLIWSDFSWLNGYWAKLNIMDWEHADCGSKSEALISLLIGRNFNDERFFIFCKKYIQARMAVAPNKQMRLMDLALCEKLVLEDSHVAMTPFDAKAISISTRLVKWIKEEINYVATYEREIMPSKFTFRWSVEMIAFFFKLLHEKKIFGNITLERFSEIIAANCSSAGKEEFQASTIHSRFYKKDTELIKTVDKLLREILDDLGKFLR